ncbi:MAG TPA: formyltetrahydrofolate deformylase [Chloroflexota bacterium]
MTTAATLLLSGPDQRGLVARTTQLLYDLGANVIHADHHLDRQAQYFFQRIQFEIADWANERPQLEVAIAELCRSLDMSWTLHYAEQVKRTAILVSKQDHCLYDLVLRQRAGELNTVFTCVISNHPDAALVAATFGVPFHHLPVTRATRAAQEAQMLALLRAYGVDLLVLARYMQILSLDFLRELGCPAINIHHGFLPSFPGERPYHQAHERGVKLIGATAHYVTEELDAGPIIEQEVVRTTHADEVADLIRKGRDVEKLTLARAVRLHLEDRVLVYKNKTVVF